MRALVDQILARCEERGASTAVFEQLLSDEALSAAAPDTGPQSSEEVSAAVAKIEEMIEKDPLFILRDDQRESVDGMIRELDMEEQGEVMTRLLAQLIQALRNPDGEVRLKAVRRVGELQGALESINDRSLVKMLDATVVAVLETESNHRVYAEAGQLFHNILNRATVEQDYKQAVHVVTMLRRHTEEAGEGFQQRPEEARNILKKLADREVAVLFVAELLSEHKEASHAARDILVKLGAEGMHTVLGELKELEDRSQRFALADVIKAMGADAVDQLMREAERESNTKIANRLLGVAARVGQEDEVLRSLEAMLHRASPEGRLAVVRTLGRMGGEKTIDLLCQAMRDGNPSVATEAMRLVEEAPSEKATPVLVELVRGALGLTQTEQVKEAACRALGAIGDAGAVQCLLEVAKKPGLVERLLKRGCPSEVRCAATAALRRFRNQPDVGAVLHSLLGDSDSHVRDTATWCLGS